MDTSWRGYRGDSPAGCLGRVEAIVSAGEEPSTPLLAVRLGRHGRQLGFFPLGDVSRVDPSRRAVVLGRVGLVRTA